MGSTIIFLDTEFTGLQRHTTLISLGMVSQGGREFYAEFKDYDTTQVTPWITEHVLDKLNGQLPPANANDVVWGNNNVQLSGTRREVATALRQWLATFGTVEVWADVLAYDWVLFCNLFGGAFSIPENIFYAPFDLSTLFRVKGIITPTGKYEGDVSRFEYAGADKTQQHHALHDARVEMLCYQKLMSNE